MSSHNVSLPGEQISYDDPRHPLRPFHEAMQDPENPIAIEFAKRIAALEELEKPTPQMYTALIR